MLQTAEGLNIFWSLNYNLGTPCFCVCHHNNLISAFLIWILSWEQGTHASQHSWLYATIHTYNGILTLTHTHFTYQTSTQCHGNWRDNISLTSVTCFVTFSNTCKRTVQYLLWAGKFSAVIRTHKRTQTHTHTISLAIKRALPVWVLHLVSVFSTDCSGSGVSLLALLMWRDDTCGCWIECHKGFQIGNV